MKPISRIHICQEQRSQKHFDVVLSISSKSQNKNRDENTSISE